MQRRKTTKLTLPPVLESALDLGLITSHFLHHLQQLGVRAARGASIPVLSTTARTRQGTESGCEQTIVRTGMGGRRVHINWRCCLGQGFVVRTAGTSGFSPSCVLQREREKRALYFFQVLIFFFFKGAIVLGFVLRIARSKPLQQLQGLKQEYDPRGSACSGVEGHGPASSSGTRA